MLGNRIYWQCTEEDVKYQLARVDNLKTIYHNGKFDVEVLYFTCGIKLHIYWDTMIGARLLDENERASLKQQYISKIDPSIEKYSIEHLFEGVDYELFTPELFSLYAATDAFMTYKLYEWQLEKFESKGNERLYNLFRTVEMSVLPAVIDMELIGVCIDTKYCERLKKKYDKQLNKISAEISKELEKYQPEIAKWASTPEANQKQKNKAGEYAGKSKLEQLDDPINIDSPTQFAILLYDILKAPIVDTKSARGTGEKILEKILEKRNIPLCKLILEKRGLKKLLSTYVEKMPLCISPRDNRLHAHFNQIGADTGRFSSSDPNLQNIPAHEDSIRMMFVASEGYTMVGSDYSQQEPRLLAWYSQDENMINAYKNGKDLYATIAADIYHNKYEDNLEHLPDGSTFKEGKERRSSVKGLLLGLLYGMGVSSLAERIGKSIEEAQSIIDRFFQSYPKVERWMADSRSFAKKEGYVEDIWGRRRRLKDIQLPKYQIEAPQTFNPLLGSRGINDNDKRVSTYKEMLSKATNRKEVNNIKTKAQLEGIHIKDNQGFIAEAERQSVNARIQGGAATMSKKAMILVHADEELNSLGFRLLIVVHDELIGECPIENAEKVKERLSYVMRQAALPECEMPMKCDADSFDAWYEDVVTMNVRNEYEELIQKNHNPEEAFKILQEDRVELTENQLKEMISGEII